MNKACNFKLTAAGPGFIYLYIILLVTPGPCIPNKSVIKSRGKMDFCLDDLRCRKVTHDQLSLITNEQKMNVNKNS